MSVEIEPSELSFRRPFLVELSQTLKIKNTSPLPIAFKVKTTAPKQYCVRPNSGRIEPGHEVGVSVLLQAMKREPPPDTRCRDKFLVQSVTITGDKEFADVAHIWETVDKAGILERKIRVNWLLPDGEAPQNDATTTPARRSIGETMATPDDRPPAYSPPAEEAAEASTINKPEPERVKEILREKTNSREPFGQPDTPASNPTTERPHNEESDQPKAARAELPAVKAEVRAPREKEGELFQRKGHSTQSTTLTGPPRQQQQQQQAVRQGTEGVPVQVVAMLCLVSFLLAYFLF